MDIRLINLEKRYFSSKGHYIQALSGINLDINDGNYIALVGPTGSGKSTLLNILTGLIKPTKGEIYWGNLCLNKATDKEINQKKRALFGIVFQDNPFIPELTVRENIVLPLIINGITPQSKKDYFEKLVQKLHIEHLVHRYPDELSGGERRKVSIARALMGNPKILIADEPTTNLDQRVAEEVLNILANLNQLGLTILVSTHDKRFTRFAKESYFMNQGRIEHFQTN